MSSLPGHGKITEQAIREIAREPRYAAVFSPFAKVSVAANVMARDVIDAVILGHWADFGQCHHFMRRFDGQSQREAYAEAVDWIRRNAVEAARQLARHAHAARGPGGQLAVTGAQTPFSQSLGNALHALQDSFALGHVEREEPLGSTPGDIRAIKRYYGDEKKDHAVHDEDWQGTGSEGTFSSVGRLAIEASKDLLRVIADSSATARGGRAVELLGFEMFRTRWLRPSEKLSGERDRAFDLIDRFAAGIRLGATNIKTINMDEDGLAAALADEAGTDTALVLDVFRRLDDQYNSDADDVAEIYVNLVRKRRGALENAVKANPELVKVLIQVMDEGWTSAGEADCIRYLRTLQ